MASVLGLIGTLRTSFRIAKATFDAAGLTAARTLTLPDVAGTLALINQQLLTAIKVAAGTATANTQPIKLSSGSLLTTPEAGSIEYLTNALYFTPNASNRGVVPAVHLVALTADFTLADSTSAQNCLTAANDTLTLPASTSYFFEGLYIINTGTTTHKTDMLFALGGGMSITAIDYVFHSWRGTTAMTLAASQNTSRFNDVTAKTVQNTNTDVEVVIQFTGTLRVNAAGTIAPQIQFNAAPGGTNLMKRGSYIRFYPFGTDTAEAVGNWS